MNAKVLSAIFKRNFVSYFSNPTGYVFMCLFVALSSAAAFWPSEFFAANLANLNQLNQYFPYIMLLFIPAITMATWSEERQRGTDELLLTIPANDFDVVMGKYLATFAIYMVSLIFSFVSNAIVLQMLGEPDFGMLVCNYLGYMFVGMAMLAVGMIGSFLTGNLTIGFVLGFLLNAPLVLMDRATGGGVMNYSIPENLKDFGRGVVSLSSIVYFVGIVVIALYLCMILIERRHWAGGRDEASKLGHFLLRTIALVGCVFFVFFISSNRDFVRLDLTVDRINSVSPDTVTLIRNLNVKEQKDLDERLGEVDSKINELKGKDDDASKKKLAEVKREKKKLDREARHLDRKVLVEAFVSPKVPEKYEQQRLTLLARLEEIKQLNPDKLEVRVYETTNFSDEAKRARKQYGIKAERREVNRWSQEEFFLGAAVTAGLDKVIIPFFEIGTSVEYELMRSISTVGRPRRKKLGVVGTDAHMMGRIDMQSMMSGGSQPQPIIAEFGKQYEIVEVNARDLIFDPTDEKSREKFDALLVVQPSTLPQRQLDNVIAAINAGVPTAIFEDPFPGWFRGVPGTDAPRQPRQSMLGRPAPQEPKGDLKTLLDTLGIRMVQVKSENLSLELIEKQKSDSKDDPTIYAEDPLVTFERLDLDGSKTISFGEFVRDPSKQGSDMLFEQEQFLAMDTDRNKQLSRDEFTETAVIWQDYNPYPKLERMEVVTNQWVFTGPGAPGADETYKLPRDIKVTDAFSGKSKITSGMKEVLFLLPGAIKPLDAKELERLGKSNLKFTPLVTTGSNTGVIRVDDINAAGDDQAKLEEFEQDTGERYVVAARIHESRAASSDDEKKNKHPLNVVFVADIDPLSSNFLGLRARQVPDLDLFFQDIPFVLNIVDDLTGDDRYLNLRKNEVRYRKLTTVEKRKEKARKKTSDEEKKFRRDAKQRIEKLRKENRKNLLQAQEDLKKLDENSTDPIVQKQRRDMINLMRMKQDESEKAFAREQLQLQQKRDDDIERIQHQLDGEVASLEREYKWWAVCLPPIPPLLVAIIVFFTRRSKEREGVSRKRLR